MIEIAGEIEELKPRICVVGVGGAGGNAVANMMRGGVKGVTFVAANTDAQALRASPAPHLLQLGRETTGGLGAGSRADIGKAAAEESLPEIERMLDGANLCFLTVGLGGGTGTGAAPVIARSARDRGILTAAVATLPFAFEGRRRAAAAAAGLEALRAEVDTLIVIPNQNLFRIADAATPFRDAFALADGVLQQGVRGITDLIVVPGLINLDFADIRTVMANMGQAMMGTGEADGEDRAMRAADAAIANPLLDEAVKGARGVMLSITGGEDLRLMEVDEIAARIRDLADPEADIIWGSAFDPELDGRVRVSVVATGIEEGRATVPAQEPAVTEAAVPLPLPETRLEPLDEPVAPPDEAELLLTVERSLVLAPPPETAAAGSNEAEPVAPCARERRDEPARREPGPSLFERMAEAARGVARQVRAAGEQPPLPHLHRGRGWPEQRIAGAA